MASRYREGAPVDDADAASEGEPEVVVEAPPLEPEPAAIQRNRVQMIEG